MAKKSTQITKAAALMASEIRNGSDTRIFNDYIVAEETNNPVAKSSAPTQESPGPQPPANQSSPSFATLYRRPRRATKKPTSPQIDKGAPLSFSMLYSARFRRAYAEYCRHSWQNTRHYANSLRPAQQLWPPTRFFCFFRFNRLPGVPRANQFIKDIEITPYVADLFTGKILTLGPESSNYCSLHVMGVKKLITASGDQTFYSVNAFIRGSRKSPGGSYFDHPRGYEKYDEIHAVLTEAEFPQYGDLCHLTCRPNRSTGALHATVNLCQSPRRKRREFYNPSYDRFGNFLACQNKLYQIGYVSTELPSSDQLLQIIQTKAGKTLNYCFRRIYYNRVGQAITEYQRHDVQQTITLEQYSLAVDLYIKVANCYAFASTTNDDICYLVTGHIVQRQFFNSANQLLTQAADLTVPDELQSKNPCEADDKIFANGNFVALYQFKNSATAYLTHIQGPNLPAIGSSPTLPTFSV